MGYYETYKAEVESVYPYISSLRIWKHDCAYNAESSTAVNVSDY